MSQGPDPDRWARLRFAIIGPLLAAPPAQGELRTALEGLARRRLSFFTPMEPFRFHLMEP